MISMKTNRGKLPIPQRRHQESVKAPTPQPALKDRPLPRAVIEAGEIMGDIPADLSRKEHPELNTRTKPGSVAALAAQIQDPEKRVAVEKADADTKTKRAARPEKTRQ